MVKARVCTNLLSRFYGVLSLLIRPTGTCYYRCVSLHLTQPEVLRQVIRQHMCCLDMNLCCRWNMLYVRLLIVLYSQSPNGLLQCSPWCSKFVALFCVLRWPWQSMLTSAADLLTLLLVGMHGCQHSIWSWCRVCHESLLLSLLSLFGSLMLLSLCCSTLICLVNSVNT